VDVKGEKYARKTSVADPHHVDVDPDPCVHFDADPDPAFHSVADPDPYHSLLSRFGTSNVPK
jgi:hypothetical protein